MASASDLSDSTFAVQSDEDSLVIENSDEDSTPIEEPEVGSTDWFNAGGVLPTPLTKWALETTDISIIQRVYYDSESLSYFKVILKLARKIS